MVMRSYCLVILNCVAQRVPLSAVFCVFGDMIIMRKANSGFFTGVTTESWIRSGLWRPSPQACLSSRPHVYQLIRMPGSRASPRLSLFPRYSSTVNVVRSSTTFWAQPGSRTLSTEKSLYLTFINWNHSFESRPESCLFLFFFSPGATTICGFVFCSPLSGL